LPTEEDAGSPKSQIEFINFDAENGKTTPVVGNTTFDTVYATAKLIPEVFGRINKFSIDVANKVEVESNMKTKKKQVALWAKGMNLKILLQETVQDLLLTGNAYWEVVSSTKSQLRTMIDVMNKSFESSITLDSILKTNPQLCFPVDMVRVRPTTIRIRVDKHGNLEGYTQTPNGGETINFTPKEIIHFRLARLDDDVYGFSKIYPLVLDLTSLVFAKSYNKNFFKNNATPDIMFMFPDEKPKSKLIVEFKKDLKQRHKQGRRGPLVSTGNIDFKVLNEFKKDAEFLKGLDRVEKMLDEVIGTTPALFGHQSAERSSDLSLQPYFVAIGSMQDDLERVMDLDLSQRFFDGNVEFILSKNYRRDEIREATVINLLLNGPRPVITMQEARIKAGYGSDVPTELLKPPVNNQNPKPPGNNQAQDNNANGDREDSNDKKIKVMIQLFAENAKIRKSSTMEIPNFDIFVALVESSSQRPFVESKVFFQEFENRIILYFSDGLYFYTHTVLKETIDVEEFKMRFLTGAIEAIPRNNM